MSSENKLEEALLPQTVNTVEAYNQTYPEVSETFDCRICGGGQISKDDPLLAPCACMGGLSLVHSRCLMKWIEMRPQQDEEQMMKCEICREPYKVELKYRFSCRAEKVCQCKPLGYVLEALMLLFCLTCTTIMMIIVEPKLADDDESSSVMVWSLFGITCVMAFVAFKKIVSRFVVSASYTEIVSTEPGPFSGGQVGNPLAGGGDRGRQSNLERVEEGR
ncbi:hypothetical protein TL16_g04282 [Triparma laevis f. inornata]|uniref:RING-CH-type domain-containing protein n=2 Tax=Triparma laevis TaxID=1534972 RepID=A0A9W6ZV12_9STRA|nr:hypothetical protein TrLO_g11414 [Triparma laevis f. longispina]GMH65798.1 hypothetical protein TL16_g04282 [Triparma laevis f. inornata]